MTTFRSLSFLLFGSAAACFGQCNPHPFRPNMLPPCASIADRLSQAHDAAVDFNNRVDELNKGIDAARKRFWKAYPSGPDFNAAEAAFLGALQEKDFYYLLFSLQEGINGHASILPNLIGLTGGVVPADGVLDKFPTNVDSGIRPYAFPMFQQWVNALRRAEGRERDGAMASPLIIASAIQDKSNQRKAYEHARNWAEFTSSGLDISKYVTPQAYILKQMESDVSWELEQAKTAEMPDGETATRDLYNFFVKAFGEKEVAAAADATLRAPKNSMGGLAKRADVEIGTYFSSSPNPYMLFLTQLTKSTPRNYAIAMAFDQYAMLGGQATLAFNTKEQWEKAFSVYNQLNAKFGEATVTAAATRLKAIPKDPVRGIRGDPQAKGVLYWFTVLLKDPKAEMPDGQLAHFKATSYDPRWNGRIVEVRGTVSRVDVDKNGSPKYATIHFKDTPTDGIAGYCPYSDMLQGTYGPTFAGLIGKVVDISGEIGQWREGAGVRILDLSQIKVLAASAGDFTESRPDWLTAPKPPSNLVDSPKYLAWKKYPAGTKVVYELRNLREYTPESDQYTRNKISRMTFTLESIDDKRVIIATESVISHITGGPDTHSAGNQLIYRPKVTRDVADAERQPPTAKGEETLTISGKKIATTWESVASPNDALRFTKTWYSDDVPGGLVLQHVHDHTNILGKTYRNITETIYAPVDGVSPELAKENSVGEAPAGYVAQPSAPARQAPPPAATPAPAPAPVRSVAPPVQRRVPPPITTDPAISKQIEFSRQYGAVLSRVAQAKSGLAQYQYQRRQAGLPDEVRAARDRLDGQLQAVIRAMGARDYGLAEQDLHAVEDTVTVIQRFLGK